MVVQKSGNQGRWMRKPRVWRPSPRRWREYTRSREDVHRQKGELYRTVVVETDHRRGSRKTSVLFLQLHPDFPVALWEVGTGSWSTSTRLCQKESSPETQEKVRGKDSLYRFQVLPILFVCLSPWDLIWCKLYFYFDFISKYRQMCLGDPGLHKTLSLKIV